MKITGRSDVESKSVDSSDEAIKEIEEKVENCKQIGDSFQLYMRTLQSNIDEASKNSVL